MANWFNANTRLPVESTYWTTLTYCQYLFAIYSWATDLGEAPDTLEHIIFDSTSG